MKTFRIKCGAWHLDVKANDIFEALDEFMLYRTAVIDMDNVGHSRFDQFEHLEITTL